jgi:hypothetical protein
MARPARIVDFGLRLATAGARRLPDFLIIGTHRGGTTSLYESLVRHPEVLPAFRKEVHFFDNNFHRGLRWYRAHFPLTRDRGALTGEATPYYLVHPAVPARATAMLPRVRLIALVRNPVDRAYSHYWRSRHRGHETLTFEEAIEREPERLRAEPERLAREPRYKSLANLWHSYCARGLYAEQLECWLRHVPRQQLLVLQSEQLFSDPEGTIGQALTFLGLEPDPAVRLARRNVGDYEAAIDPRTRARLAEWFRPHNERLFSLLGTRYEWDR